MKVPPKKAINKPLNMTRSNEVTKELNKEEPNYAITAQDVSVLVPLIHEGLKATGIQLFQQGGAVILNNALAKLQKIVLDEEEAAKKGGKE
jgi:hypothetical protein